MYRMINMKLPVNNKMPIEKSRDLISEIEVGEYGSCISSQAKTPLLIIEQKNQGNKKNEYFKILHGCLVNKYFPYDTFFLGDGVIVI